MPQYNYKDLSSDNLRSYARDLQRVSQEIQEIAEWMDEDGVPAIEARNSSIGERAIGFATKYAYALKEAMIDYKQQNGFYRAETKPKKSAAATKATRGKKKATKKKG